MSDDNPRTTRDAIADLGPSRNESSSANGPSGRQKGRQGGLKTQTQTGGLFNMKLHMKVLHQVYITKQYEHIEQI